MTKTTTTDERQNRAVRTIASTYLGIVHLDERNRDSLDFHDLKCSNVHAALIAAYEAGMKAASESSKA